MSDRSLKERPERACLNDSDVLGVDGVRWCDKAILGTRETTYGSAMKEKYLGRERVNQCEP